MTRSIARGCPAHLVQTAADIEVEWFSGSDLVGLTAGTSTPPDTIEEVDEALREL